MSTTSPVLIDSYQLEDIDQSRINEIIAGLNPEKTFNNCLNHFACGRHSDRDNLSDEILNIILEESFKRLAYALCHELRSMGENISMASLILLCAHLNGVYESMISDGPDFTEVCDWNNQLASTYEILSNYVSPSGKLVGAEYINSVSIDSVLSNETYEQALARIDGIIQGVRDRFQQTAPDQSRENVFEGVSWVLSDEFMEARKEFEESESLIDNIVDEVVEFLEASYETSFDVLKDEAAVYKNIPAKFSQYSALLEQKCFDVSETFDKVFEKKVLPVLDSIWSAIITISIEILENRQEAEEERKEAEPQGFNSKGSKLLN